MGEIMKDRSSMLYMWTNHWNVISEGTPELMSFLSSQRPDFLKGAALVVLSCPRPLSPIESKLHRLQINAESSRNKAHRMLEAELMVLAQVENLLKQKTVSSEGFHHVNEPHQRMWRSHEKCLRRLSPPNSTKPSIIPSDRIFAKASFLTLPAPEQVFIDETSAVEGAKPGRHLPIRGATGDPSAEVQGCQGALMLAPDLNGENLVLLGAGLEAIGLKEETEDHQLLEEVQLPPARGGHSQVEHTESGEPCAKQSEAIRKELGRIEGWKINERRVSDFTEGTKQWLQELAPDNSYFFYRMAMFAKLQRAVESNKRLEGDVQTDLKGRTEEKTVFNPLKKKGKRITVKLKRERKVKSSAEQVEVMQPSARPVMMNRTGGKPKPGQAALQGKRILQKGDVDDEWASRRGEGGGHAEGSALRGEFGESKQAPSMVVVGTRLVKGDIEVRERKPRREKLEEQETHVKVGKSSGNVGKKGEDMHGNKAKETPLSGESKNTHRKETKKLTAKKESVIEMSDSHAMKAVKQDQITNNTDMQHNDDLNPRGTEGPMLENSLGEEPRRLSVLGLRLRSSLRDSETILNSTKLKENSGEEGQLQGQTARSLAPVRSAEKGSNDREHGMQQGVSGTTELIRIATAQIENAQRGAFETTEDRYVRRNPSQQLVQRYRGFLKYSDVSGSDASRSLSALGSNSESSGTPLHSQSHQRTNLSRGSAGALPLSQAIEDWDGNSSSSSVEKVNPRIAPSHESSFAGASNELGKTLEAMFAGSPSLDSNGLSEKSNCLPEKFNGLSEESNGLSQKSNGLSEKSNGLSEKSNGLSEKSNGLSQKSNGLSEKFNSLSEESNGLSQKSNGLKGKPGSEYPISSAPMHGIGPGELLDSQVPLTDEFFRRSIRYDSEACGRNCRIETDEQGRETVLKYENKRDSPELEGWALTKTEVFQNFSSSSCASFDSGLSSEQKSLMWSLTSLPQFFEVEVLQVGKPLPDEPIFAFGVTSSSPADVLAEKRRQEQAISTADEIKLSWMLGYDFEYFDGYSDRWVSSSFSTKKDYVSPGDVFSLVVTPSSSMLLQPHVFRNRKWVWSGPCSIPLCPLWGLVEVLEAEGAALKVSSGHLGDRRVYMEKAFDFCSQFPIGPLETKGAQLGNFGHLVVKNEQGEGRNDAVVFSRECLDILPELGVVRKFEVWIERVDANGPKEIFVGVSRSKRWSEAELYSEMEGSLTSQERSISLMKLENVKQGDCVGIELTLFRLSLSRNGKPLPSSLDISAPKEAEFYGVVVVPSDSSVSSVSWVPSSQFGGRGPPTWKALKDLGSSLRKSDKEGVLGELGPPKKAPPIYLWPSRSKTKGQSRSSSRSSSVSSGSSRSSVSELDPEVVGETEGRGQSSPNLLQEEEAEPSSEGFFGAVERMSGSPRGSADDLDPSFSLVEKAFAGGDQLVQPERSWFTQFLGGSEESSFQASRKQIDQAGLSRNSRSFSRPSLEAFEGKQARLYEQQSLYGQQQSFLSEEDIPQRAVGRAASGRDSRSGGCSGGRGSRANESVYSYSSASSINSDQSFSSNSKSASGSG